MRSSRTAWGVLVVALLLGPTSAWAGACGDGFVEAQQLEKDGKLLAAREKYLSCAVESCGKNLSKECRERYEAIQPRIPTVTLEAWRGETQLTTFEVTVDGVAVKATGAAVELDPGTHTFVFTVDGQSVKQQFMAVESKKGQSVKGVFPVASKPPEPKPEANLEPTFETKPEPKPEANSKPEEDSSPVAGSYRGPLGLLVGGLGIAGMGVGVALGLSAKSLADSADCRGSVCATQAAADTRHMAVSRAGTATIVFGVGAALAVGGIVVWLTAPSKRDAKPQVGIQVGPASMQLALRF